jgi:UPF0716 family protein affecting phage T7 exclusion
MMNTITILAILAIISGVVTSISGFTVINPVVAQMADNASMGNLTIGNNTLGNMTGGNVTGGNATGSISSFDESESSDDSESGGGTVSDDSEGGCFDC